jgi:hypothetical protein
VAIYHCSVKTLSRSKGHNAVAAAAYRAGAKILDEASGKVHDYSKRSGVADSFIELPYGAPLSLMNRSTLWNKAERSEVRKNSRIAREIVIALPYELSRTERRTLTRAYSRWVSERYGVAVDCAIHLPSPEEGHDQRNHHAHLLFTTRAVGPAGLSKKTRALDDKHTGPQEIEAIRYAWECLCNTALERADIPSRVNRHSLIDQGIERIPQVHMGARAFAMYLQDKKPISSTALYKKIDTGSRPAFNSFILRLNKKRAMLPSIPLDIQVYSLEILIKQLSDKLDVLERLLPHALLPEFLKRRIEHTKLRLIALTTKQRFEALSRVKRLKQIETERLHLRIETMRRKIKTVEEKRALLKSYSCLIESIAAQTSTITLNKFRAPTPFIITTTKFNENLKLKAKMMRLSVPPPHRVNFSLLDPVKKCNGGMAKPPALLMSTFNQAAEAPVPVIKTEFKIEIR